jgi:glycosyltransferase involved in cell wall biosynthesis
MITGNVVRQFYLWQRNLVLRRSSCDFIAIEDERYLDSLSTGTGKGTVFLPETTSVEVCDPPPEPVRNIRSRKDGATVVGLLGALSSGKGIDLLVDVIKNCNTEGFFFLIAGPCGPRNVPPALWNFLTNEIHNYPNVVYSPNPIPSEPEFNALITACDIVYCAYKGHLHSSNVLSKAVAFRKPLLVNDGELMAKRVREYGIGCVLLEQTAEACLKAFREMSTPEYRGNLGKTGRFEKYLEDHSFENFRKVMTSLSAEAA